MTRVLSAGSRERMMRRKRRPPPFTQPTSPQEATIRSRSMRALAAISVLGSVLVVGFDPAIAEPTQGPDSAQTNSTTLATHATRLWVQRYNGSASPDSRAADVGVSPDGSTVFVTGKSHGPGSGLDYATVAYDSSTGTELWVQRFAGPGNAYDVAVALGVSPDGSTVYVTGTSYRSSSGLDLVTLAYDASTGAERWVARYNGCGEQVRPRGGAGREPRWGHDVRHRVRERP